MGHDRHDGRRNARNAFEEVCRIFRNRQFVIAELASPRDSFEKYFCETGGIVGTIMEPHVQEWVCGLGLCLGSGSSQSEFMRCRW